MPTIRIGNLNVENLLNRFNFHSYGRLTRERVMELFDLDRSGTETLLLRKGLTISLSDDSRQQTAQVIRDTQADVICLQEVENKETLDGFHEGYVEKSTGVRYGWRRVVEGNDLRGIDVGVMAKERITVRSHQHWTFDDFGLFNDDLADYGLVPNGRIFRRDCLQIDLKADGVPLTLFACHFKSMSGGRAKTRCVREAEAKAVRRIVESTFGDDVGNANWAILGDLNDYVEDNRGTPDPGHALGALLDDGFSVNLVARRPVGDRWTHYYPKDGSAHQIDYIMASPGLAERNAEAVPDIIRRGQPYRVEVPAFGGVPAFNESSLRRYPRTGFDRPKASDHCAVAVSLNID